MKIDKLLLFVWCKLQWKHCTFQFNSENYIDNETLKLSDIPDKIKSINVLPF